jgi:hypothetical protein
LQVYPDYDGVDDAILHMSKKYLATHELVQEFWNHSCNGRISFKGFFRAKIMSWEMDAKDVKGSSCVNLSCIHLLHAVMTYRV